MSDIPPSLETLWERLLSRDIELVRRAYQELTPEEQQAVLGHLKRMASESGWHPEQQRSADFALVVLLDQRPDKA